MAIETFNIPWVRAHKRKLSFKTEIDGEYTSHEQRAAMRSVGAKSWSLSFEKHPSAIGDVFNFFDRHKGKFKSFYWKYDSKDKYGRPTGGDDVTYIVRFDTDDFDEAVQSGYSTFDLPIVRLMSNE